MMFMEAETWVVIAFLLFAGMVGKLVWESLLGILDSRSERIRAELHEATRLREDAVATLAAYQKRQQEALAEAQAIVARAQEEAENIRRRAEADLEASLRRREQQAMDRIAQAETAAVEEVRNMTVDLAVSASRKLLADGITIANQDKLVEHAIAEIPKNLH